MPRKGHHRKKAVPRRPRQIRPSPPRPPSQPGFLRRHWNKISLAGAVAAGVYLAPGLTRSAINLVSNHFKRKPRSNKKWSFIDFVEDFTSEDNSYMFG